MVTSFSRIPRRDELPSDKGYRFYVDQIIKEKDSQVGHMQELMIQRVDRVELLLKQLAKVLANNTNYATLISGPSYNQTKLKFIQLSKVEEHKLLVVVVVEGNIIRNSFVTIDEELSDEELLNLNILLNSSLNGLTIEEINLGVIAKMKEQAGSHRRVVDLVLNEVSEVIRSPGRRSPDLYQRGNQYFQIPGAFRYGKSEPADRYFGT